jgi:hypothetical protein
LPVSGLRDFAVVVRGSAGGPLWLTGGDYGIEASAVGTAVILVGLALVAKLAKEHQVAVLSAEAGAAETMAGELSGEPTPANGDSHPTSGAAESN